MKRLNGQFVVTIICLTAFLSACTENKGIVDGSTEVIEIDEKQDLVDYLQSDFFEGTNFSLTIEDIVHSDLQQSPKTRSEDNPGDQEEEGGIPMILDRGHWNLFGGFNCWGHMISWCNKADMDRGATHDDFYVYPIANKITPTKFRFDFADEHTGFTGDGFLPLDSPVYFTNDLADALEIPHGAYIADGIYPAIFDPTVGYYNSIILDLNW